MSTSSERRSVPEVRGEGEGRGKTILTVEGLSVGYGDEPVLENVSFRVRASEIVAILGPSGCGKTTLLRSLIGLLSPLRGRICVAGEELGGNHRDRNLDRIHSHIGVLFQADALVGSLSLAENISLPLEELTELPPELIAEMVRLKLDLVGLGENARQLPSELSGGMQKRAGLARAMALDPEILFCDEPTAGLDPATAVEVDRLLLELRKTLGITVVLITHELASIENIADRCLMLNREARGIIADGTPRELMDSEDSRVRNFFRRSVADERTGRKERP